MSSSKLIESVTITSADSQGKGFVSFDITLKQCVSPVQITYAGSTLSFASSTAFQTFVTEVLIPTANIIHSPSGAGAGYVTATPGTAGADALTA